MFLIRWHGDKFYFQRFKVRPPPPLLLLILGTDSDIYSPGTITGETEKQQRLRLRDTPQSRECPMSIWEV